MNIKSIDLRSDAAENSIMQTITIAVSAILIAAGLVTAPGLINNARDNNATTDLANIAYAQEFNLANTGEYASLSTIATNTQNAINEGGSAAKLTRSGGVAVTVAYSNPTGAAATYTLIAVSQSGKVFTRDSSSGATKQFEVLEYGSLTDYMPAQFQTKVTLDEVSHSLVVEDGTTAQNNNNSAILSVIGESFWE